MLTKLEEHHKIVYEFVSKQSGEKVQIVFLDTEQKKFVSLQREDSDTPEIWDAEMLLDLCTLIASHLRPNTYNPGTLRSNQLATSDDLTNVDIADLRAIGIKNNELAQESDDNQVKQHLIDEKVMADARKRGVRSSYQNTDMYPKKSSEGKGFRRE